LALGSFGGVSAIAATPADSGTPKPESSKPEASKPASGKAEPGKPPSGKSSAKPAAPGGAKPSGNADPGAAKPAAPSAPQRFDIGEYRIEGADNLPQIEVETAVYPFLGPYRTPEDVEKARAALEKAYHDKGFQTVGVSVPQQDAQRGFVVLKVAENKVGRLRVKNSRYFDLANIKEHAPSLKEGKLPDFQAVTRDIVSLNRWSDRRVTPALRAGITPGTVDVDLNVDDTFPMHGSLELNDRQSPSTSLLRLNASLRYDNLWQLGHSISASYQVAPMNPDDAMVISGSYMARTDYDWLNVLVYGLKSTSNVATVGGASVVGPGEVIGARAVMTLPPKGELFHTFSFGPDYKHFQQSLTQGLNTFSSPVTYVPLVGAYSATWQADGRQTQLNATITAGLRGIGSTPEDFDIKRFKATESFIHLRADLAHTQDLPGGAQFYAKMQGQIADQPLVSSEQISFGGHDTVRGYLESEVLGDYGAAGTLELRTPNIAPYMEQKLDNPPGAPVKFNLFNDWRFFGFVDAARARIHEPLPEQEAEFDLASYGIGTRWKSLTYLNGTVFVGMPMISQQVTRANNPRVSFRIWGEF
jgi:hemolysin activation/secretion protein